MKWDTGAVAARVEELLSQFTTEEKAAYVTGDLNFDYGFYSRPPERLDLPALTMADGPAGVRINRGDVHEGRATALPAPIALAATWAPELARAYGDVLGAEAFASGHNVQLGPAVDIARVPTGGRTFESFGEDPLLASEMGVGVIRGIQAHPVQACVKHFAANNQEDARATIDVRVDERTLMELYLPPFEAAVRQGGVASVMAAFNQVNGSYACQSRDLLTSILRDRFGFRGWVMSDYGANHATAESANAGLDQEQPTAGHWGEQLLAAVRGGQVAEETLDEMVRRILRPQVGLGQLEQRPAIAALNLDAHAELAQQVAEQSMVLLGNSSGLLPLRAGELSSLAVIGPEVGSAAAAGGGSSRVRPARPVSPAEGIAARVGPGVRVEVADGADPVSAGALLPGPVPVPSAVLSPPGAAPGGRGLRGEYWDNPRFAGDPRTVRVDPQVDLNLGFFNFPGFNGGSPRLAPYPTELNGQTSARWTGTLTAPATGQYVLAVTSLGSFALHLDGRLALGTMPAALDSGDPVPTTKYPYGALTMRGPGTRPEVSTASLDLVAGQRVDILLEYAADTAEQGFLTGAQVRLGWVPPDGLVPPDAAAAAGIAARCDAAVVIVRGYESEGADRPSLLLPNGQEELVRAVCAANPRTAVVLMTGSPVQTQGWDEEAGAVVQAWFPGQQQGTALARVLFGDADPGGRLPLTFPVSDGQVPLRGAAAYPGEGGQVTYDEGVFVGYRGYDSREIEPRFPFGYGLSYTSFSYSSLTVQELPARLAKSGEPTGDDVAEVAVTVGNTGDRGGWEVVQLYVGALPAPVPTPPRALAGFAKVWLEPDQARQVTLRVPRRSVSYWDTATGEWIMPVGTVGVYAGRSSRDLPLCGRLRVG